MHRILIVDDDPVLLTALQDGLNRAFEVEVSTNPKAALLELSRVGDYSVIVSDMRMPEMDGVTLLKQAREIAPSVSRVMLTSADDMQTAVQAINEGSVCRFLTKPCPLGDLQRAIEDAIEAQKRFVELLETQIKTVKGATNVLVKLIQMVTPDTYAAAEKQRQRMRELALELLMSQLWELEVAAMLAPLGKLSSPEGKEAPASSALFGHFPQAAAALLKQIPRLDTVARTVGYLNKNFDGTGLPSDELAGTAIPIGSRMLRIVRDMELLMEQGMSCQAALSLMQEKTGMYDPDILSAAQACFAGPESDPALCDTREVDPADLSEGAVLAGDIETLDGVQLLTSGCRITPNILHCIREMAGKGTIPPRIPVRVPLNN